MSPLDSCWLTEDDIRSFKEGANTRMYRKLGGHLVSRDGVAGAHFGVWAPNAQEIAIIGDFNRWNGAEGRLQPWGNSGLFEGFVPHASQGDRYKIHVKSEIGGYNADKADPYAIYAEAPPATASILWRLQYDWGDAAWMARRADANGLHAPISIYDVHLGSWRRRAEEGNRSLTYRELGQELVQYVKDTGFTHVEFFSPMTGYFAPASRYGIPQDFMWLIDQFHQNGIGVILDWIPSYGRNEVGSFLLSSAMFWLDVYHADGIRVGIHDGPENPEAVSFLRQLNETVYREHPDVQTFAEEPTGGLAFGSKWDTRWMHEMLAYLSQDPFFRKYCHDKLTSRIQYAYSENFTVPMSHDAGSLIGRIPGSNEEKFASLRALFAYMYTQPGKKLLFMGDEFGQWTEWNAEAGLDWALLDVDAHARLRLLVGALNHLYRTERALTECDSDPTGFEWIDASDAEKNVISYIRKGKSPDEMLLVVCHFSPVLRTNYRIGASRKGFWRELLNTDAEAFGGGGNGNFGGVTTVPVPLHGRPYSLTLTVPPLSVLVFRHEG